MKELGALAVLGVREQPNLAQNLVTHSQPLSHDLLKPRSSTFRQMMQTKPDVAEEKLVMLMTC